MIELNQLYKLKVGEFLINNENILYKVTKRCVAVMTVRINQFNDDQQQFVDILIKNSRARKLKLQTQRPLRAPVFIIDFAGRYAACRRSTGKV